jgi:hypothetical protein
MSKYIAIYEKLCPDDPIAKDDPRRKEIIAEMRGIHRAKSVAEAANVIEWWFVAYIDQRKIAMAYVRKARKLMK